MGAEQPPGSGKGTPHRSPAISIRVGSFVPPLFTPPSTMAATTTGNVNGISNGFQWSPGICCQLRSSPFISPLPSSGQSSTPGWNTSRPQTSSGLSFPNNPRPLRLNCVDLSGEWPQLREIIKYKIQYVRARPPSSPRVRLTGV